jgi:hypothetical protein
MTQFDLDSLIPAEILALIELEKSKYGSHVANTTVEWQILDSRKLTRDKLVDMYNTILHIRELESKLKDRDG